MSQHAEYPCRGLSSVQSVLLIVGNGSDFELSSFPIPLVHTFPQTGAMAGSKSQKSNLNMGRFLQRNAGITELAEQPVCNWNWVVWQLLAEIGRQSLNPATMRVPGRLEIKTH
jgi:hypothetical protein